MAGALDRLIAMVSPKWALQRAIAEKQIEAMRLYDAAKLTDYRRRPTDNRSADGVMDHARGRVRDMARILDENHDLAIGVLDSLVNNTVGSKGITIEPQIKTRGGKLNKKANEAIRKAFKEWTRRAGTAQDLPWGELQRLVCRTWLRDGEILIQHVQGARTYNYPTQIPYALELIESDYLPFDMSSNSPRIVHGIEINDWRQPRAYHLYLEHPGDTLTVRGYYRNTKRVPAEAMTHLKFTRRVNQARGISILHGVINRLDDIKDYEESERIAARIAASFAAYIKKNPDIPGASVGAATGERKLDIEPGMIFDVLLPGEDIGTIASNRPNSALEPFRDSQLRAVAAGTGATFSTISRNYNGTYSAQRQELVEAQPGYDRLRNYYIQQFIDPIWRNFVQLSVASGAINLPRNIDPATLFDYEARGQGMTWIDPKKEIEADLLAINGRLKSRHQTIRDRGGDPVIVDEQIAMELENDKQSGYIQPPAEDTPPDESAEDQDNDGTDDENEAAA